MIIRCSKLILLCILFCFCACKKGTNPSNSSIELDLSWDFQKEGDSISYKATVPGIVHTDLFEQGLIEDPYYGNNELSLRWIENENWIYSTDLNISKEHFDNDHLEIEFKGLDTYAKVYLNGKLILEADNMFRNWKTDIKQIAQIGRNKLEVHFESPISHNKGTVNSYPYLLPSGNEPKDIETKVYSFTRKAAYHFGWDWGPRFVTSGIWKPVQLNVWNQARILNHSVSTLQLGDNEALMRSLVELEISKSGLYELTIDGTVLSIELDKGIHSIPFEFIVSDPKLWWTNGMGEQPLYTQEVFLKKEVRTIDTSTSNYGIRTIELINEKDSIGTSFYFKLNGKDVFMKGANYIPQDVFLPRVKKTQYVTLLKAARDANMNMLRVWGGGIYENDIFYELCDQYGILVWQDLMFAGSMYPDLPSFDENVLQEIRENIDRLKSHPCLALICGNNEMEVAWKNWGWQSQFQYSPADSTEIWDHYLRLFHNKIPQLIQSISPEIPYTSTSPLSNWGTAENFNHSSMHYWGVWHGREPFENFEKNVGRFMVEYGFQSFPAYQSLKKVIPDSSMYLESDIMKNRQKSYIGNGLISKHIAQYFETPNSFEEYADLSQKTQAKALQMAIRSHLDEQPHCMGTLFWQFNDCWPGPSWSVIDYYGNKKVAYEVVKEEFKRD